MRHAWLGLVLACTGCGGGNVQSIASQQWGDVQVLVETRPSPPLAGMNEFLVIANERDGRPAYGMVVSIRVNGQGEWHQMIQDGRTGVYRRAVPLSSPAHDVLNVQLRRKGQEGELSFRLGGATP